MYIEIKTERLLCRPLGVNDIHTVHEYASDPETARYMIWLPNETEEETREFLLAVSAEWEKDVPEFYEFAVVFEGVQIGAVSIYLNETKDAGELGWIFNKRYHKRGFAFEAANAVKSFAENELGIKKFIAQCDRRNKDSARLMERLGLTLIPEVGERVYLKTGERAEELTYKNY